MDSPEKGKIMVHIEQAEPLKQLIPNIAASGALSFFEGENRAVKCRTAAYIVSVIHAAGGAYEIQTESFYFYCDPDRGYDPGLGGSADVEGKRGNI